MELNLYVKRGVEVKKLQAYAGVRYWEDASVNGVEDTDGTLIPCRQGETWQPLIDVETGQILNWKQGTTADIHYKVCDAGTYDLLDAKGEVIVSLDDYVPEIMCPEGEGFGDYIIMKVDENGFIDKWKPSLKEFQRKAD